LIYSAYPQNPDFTKNSRYPNIYQNDLKGDVKLLKEGGYNALLSPNEKLIAHFTAYLSKDATDQEKKDAEFAPSRPNKVALRVFDKNSGKNEIVTKIYENFPDLVWSADSKYLYVIENIYVFNKKLLFVVFPNTRLVLKNTN
jgi:hypothetical protein